MIGRARGWSQRRTLGAVALAGGGHILATTALGVALARFGWEINERYDAAFHWIVAALLVGLGAWLALRAPHGRGCDHCEGRKLIPEPTDRAALWGLLFTLTLAPCELFLPVYLTSAPYGWHGIVWLSAVLAVATLGGMLTLHGAARARWRPARQENRRDRKRVRRGRRRQPARHPSRRRTLRDEQRLHLLHRLRRSHPHPRLLAAT